MITSKHTPGPWLYGDYNELRADRPNDDECILIATVCDAPFGLDYGNQRTRPHAAGEAQANARLIAAAPELLEALEAFMNACRVDGVPLGWGLVEHNARAAIAKAKGESA